MFRIVANHFVAAATVKDGKVAHAAPIIGYMIGWTSRQVRDYCARKGWKIETGELSEHDD